MRYGERAAAHYGEIKTDLQRRGKVIGPNDLHIAAHARSEAVVLTNLLIDLLYTWLDPRLRHERA